MLEKRTALLLLTVTMLGACAPASNPRATPQGIDKVCPPEETLTISPVNSNTPDTEPNPFCFAPALNVNPDQTVAISSNTITIRGINQPTTIRATLGTTIYVNDQFLEYFYDDTPSKMVNAGDKIRVLGSPSNLYNDSEAYTVTIGGVSDTFYIITKAK